MYEIKFLALLLSGAATVISLCSLYWARQTAILAQRRRKEQEALWNARYGNTDGILLDYPIEGKED